MSNVTYPLWIASAYSVELIAQSTWSPSAPDAIPIPIEPIEYNPTLSTLTEVAYTVFCGNQAGLPVHIGFIGLWPAGPHEILYAVPMVWHNGIEQNTRAPQLVNTNGWRNFGSTTRTVGTGAQTCLVTAQFFFTAVPY